MKLRTQLLLVFFLLAVVPLAGLTLYSYYTSLEAFREAVAAEGAQLAEDMTLRMESARRDLNHRVRALGFKPFYTLVSSGEERPGPEMKEVYAELVGTLGESATLLESIKIEPMAWAGGVPQVSVVSPTPPVPPSFQPGDSLHIVMSGAPEPPPPPPPPGAEGVPAPHPEEVAMEMPEGDRLLMRRWHRPQGPPRGAGGPEHEASDYRQEIQLHWIARQVEENTRRLQVAETKMKSVVAARELAEAVRRAAFAGSGGTVSDEQPGGDVAERAECLDFTTEVKMGDAMGGKISARVNARQILGTVLSRTRTREGEIAFARDREDRLYTARTEDATILAGLGVGVEDGRQSESMPEDWLVVQKTDAATGVTFGIARPIGDGLQQIRRAAVQNLSYGLGMVVLALVGILPLSRRMTRNLSTLSEGVEQLARGNLEVRVPVRSRDEFGQLGDAFNRMAHDLKEHQAQLVEQERLRKELEMCRRIQKELLPRGPLRLPLAEVQGVSIPAREVGGDFFNYFSLPDGRTALLIGDVSGKGVPAALLMANLQATLRARLPVADDLVSLATELDREIEASTPAEAYLTLFVAILDQQARTLRWLNAGHNTQYLIRSGSGLESLDSTGRPLGLLPGGKYEEKTTEIHPGDALFLYTDGLVEAENAAGDEFGNQRLEQILVEERGGESQVILARIEDEMRRFGRDFDRADDATMLVLRTTD